MNTKSALTFLTAIFLPFWLFSQNYGINFNGLNQYAASNTFSAYNSGSNVTIEFWVSLTASTGYTQFICDYHTTGASGNDRKRIIPYIDGGTSKIGVWISPNISNDVGSLNILSNTVMTTNTWYHIAVTINSSKSVKLYINGVQASSGTLSAVFSLTGSEKLFMATDYWNSTNNYANIRLDEMRLWKEERSSANISTNMNLEVPTGSSNLMAYYRMTNGSGSTISDNKSTGTAIDATITNSATWSQPGAYPVLAYTGDSYSACYTNLKTAFDQINAGVHTGSITLKMSGSTTETSTASLNKSGSGSANYSSVLIYPTADNLTITGQVMLNGASNVTINGSKNASGTVKNLTIEYKDANNPALYLSSASNNVIKNLVIKSSSTGMSSGIVRLDASLGTAGSCYNRFDSCSFTKATNGRPLNCIYSSGSSTYLNTNNTVSNSIFYDFINGSVSAGNVIKGISLQSYNDAWTINNNSFYETGGTISFPNGNEVRIISVQAENTDRTFTITNNKIGGSDASCGGFPLTGTHSAYHRFSGIYLYYGSYTLTNNVVQNISWINTDLFSGIDLENAGNISCTGNQIGSATVNNSILVSYNAAFTVYGIYSNSATVGKTHTYTGNTIGGIGLSYSGSGTNACTFYGLNERYFTTCSNNLIGSTTVSNSITTPATAGAHLVYCIRDGASGVTPNYINNTIASVTNQSTSNLSQFYGLYTISGTPTIQNNQFFNLKHSGSPFRGSFAAIRMNGPYGTSCSGNTVYNLSLDNASGNGVVVGVYLSVSTGGVSTLSKNKIYNISAASGLATLYGIYEESGKWNYDNNSISLGEENTAGSAIYGIYGTPYSNLYFNSIMIGGTVSSGSTASTYALYCSSNSASHTFKNNLIVNERTGGASGKHYAVYIPGNTNLIINNNNYYVAGAVLGSNSGTDIADLTAWRAATGQDAGSVSTAVTFASTTDLHLAGNSISDANLLGVPISGYTTDFDGVTRSPSSPTMGIHEVDSWLGSSTDWSNVNNWRGGIVPTASSTVSISFAAANQPHILNSTTALCRDISLNSGASLTIEPGGKLTVSGNFSNNGSVNIISSATGTGSLITNGTVTGSDFNIQQYLTPNKWHLISAPNNLSTANTFLGDYLQSWDESNAAWTDIIDPETPLSLMTGYTVYKSGSAATKIFEGTPATGNQSTTLSYHNLAATGNDGMNLVGNPYPSAINWDGLQGTYGAAYIWDPSASSGAGDYLEWNANTGGNQNIAPMQGFFIYTATNGSSFQLTNNNRVHASGSYYKSVQGKLQNSLVLTGSNGIYEDEFILQFDDQANAGFELSRDAWKIISGGSGISQIYSISPDGKLAMDIRPFEKVISLGFSNDTPGTYSIALKQLTDLGNAVLEDTWNNTFTDLAKGAYTFNWQPSDDEQRFRLHMGALDIKVNETDPAVTVYSHNNTLYCSLADTREADIKVYSMAGQLLINRTNVSGIQQFQLASGAYVVIIVNETNTMVKKVIVR